MRRFANPAAILVAIGLVALAAVHVFLFGFAMARLALPAVLVAAAAVLVLAAHLGLLASLAAWLRRRVHTARKHARAPRGGDQAT
ncbi:MAG TPA: hypothetical protein VN814_00255 [Caulobacteraceae bacterium]|nr:hypothetical protein [Caulobacteraceae bacterium]